MIISLIFAWIAVLATILTAAKYIVKGNKKWNMIFRKIHIPVGIILIITGIVHGILAGNVWNTSLKEASLGSVLFTANAGTLCLIVAILLGASYVLRKILKAKWMVIHRALTIVMLMIMMYHIGQVGIQLSTRIFDAMNPSNTEFDSSMSDEEMVESMEIAKKESGEEPVKESVRESEEGTLEPSEIDLSQMRKPGGKGHHRKG